MVILLLMTDMANVLNDYFCSVFTREDQTNIPDIDTHHGDTYISDITFTRGAIKRKIMDLKPTSAPGPDQLPVRLLQEFVDEIAPVLATIFTKSLQLGQVPTEWRLANVTPIHKKGAKGTPGNYRPVSLTSIPGKVMESIMTDHIVKHLEQSKLINETQHGFRANKIDHH